MSFLVRGTRREIEQECEKVEGQLQEIRAILEDTTWDSSDRPLLDGAFSRVQERWDQTSKLANRKRFMETWRVKSEVLDLSSVVAGLKMRVITARSLSVSPPKFKPQMYVS